jgi:hypothetical protein
MGRAFDMSDLLVRENGRPVFAKPPGLHVRRDEAKDPLEEGEAR